MHLGSLLGSNEVHTKVFFYVYGGHITFDDLDDHRENVIR